jgi:hypothetical protein
MDAVIDARAGDRALISRQAGAVIVVLAGCSN